MTYAFRTFAPRDAETRAASIKRCEFFAWIACILFVDDLTRIEVATSSDILPALIGNVASRSAFYYLGIYAVIRLLFESGSAREASRWDIGLGIAACLIAVLPFKSVVWLVGTACAFYLFVTSGDDRKAKAAAVVLLALAANRLWGLIFLDVFQFALLRIDAALTGIALILGHTGVAWNGNIVGASQDHTIIILPGCSSFHNISMGLLCWTALTKLARPTWNWGDLPFALAIVGTVVAFNVSRLYLMALSHDDYLYWHNGYGAQIYAYGITSAVLAISLWSACRNPGRRT